MIKAMPSALRSALLVTLVLGLLGSYTARAQQPGKDLLSRPHINYAHGVIGLPNITYNVVNGYRPMHMTLFVPTAGKGPYPVVLYLHGGGWTLDPDGDEGIMGNDTMVDLAARGYVVVRPGYRLSSEAKFPAPLKDVKTAVRWIRTYAHDFNADTSHIVVWGSSAGGFLSAMLATTCGIAEFDHADALPPRVGLSTPAMDPKVSSCVDAAIDWFGPIDFKSMDSQALPDSPGRHDDAQSAESALVGCAIPSCSAETLKAANPISYISAKTPPFLIMHGKADHGVPWQQSQELYDALRAQGVAAQIILVPDADHMFMKLPEAQMRAQLQPVFAFIDAHSGKTP